MVVAKEEDRSFFPSSARERVSVLPNGITVPSAAAPQTDRADTILFVGTLEYPPNADAITYFATEVLPRIWSRRPETRFQVAGFGRGDHLRAVLADPRCAIAESPAELASFYAAASVVVAPVRIGGGTRIKVLEALAYGKPLVTTTFGAEGIPLRRGTEVEFADTSEEMAECCLRLFDDPGRCRALGEAGRAMVMKRFDWDRVVEQLDPLLRPLVV